MKQSDTAAAISKTESSKVTLGEVLAQEEKLREEVGKIELMAERNTLLQGLITSESERRKKVCYGGGRAMVTTIYSF